MLKALQIFLLFALVIPSSLALPSFGNYTYTKPAILPGEHRGYIITFSDEL